MAYRIGEVFYLLRSIAMEANVFRITRVALACLFFVFFILAVCGCPQVDGPRRLWVLNGGDEPVTGLYVCKDPRREDWGENLIAAAVQPDSAGQADLAISPDETCWVWPYLDGHGLMAVCVMPGNTDVYLVVKQTEAGDYCTQTLGPTPSPTCLRYLLH